MMRSIRPAWQPRTWRSKPQAPHPTNPRRPPTRPARNVRRPSLIRTVRPKSQSVEQPALVCRAGHGKWYESIPLSAATFNHTSGALTNPNLSAAMWLKGHLVATVAGITSNALFKRVVVESERSSRDNLHELLLASYPSSRIVFTPTSPNLFQARGLTLVNWCCCRKNIFNDPGMLAGVKPHVSQQAEASKGPIPANPISISPAADVRRPSTVSAVSTNDVDDARPAVQTQGQLGSLVRGSAGHVPGNLLCKFPPVAPMAS
jgi:hypothetical protein